MRKRPDFLRLSREGQKAHVPHFIVLRAAAGTGTPRVGITVSRKVGNAVQRNRVKRLVREFWRRQNTLIFADYSIIAKAGADRLGYLQVAGELERALALLAGQK